MKVTVLLAALVLPLCLAPAARASCPRLPAPRPTAIRAAGVSGSSGQRQALLVCTGGHRVVLRRAHVTKAGATYIGGASVVGRHVAWIEQRLRGGHRAIDVRVVSVSSRGRVHTLRRIAVERARSGRRLVVAVLLTRAGDLTWAYSPSHGVGRIVYAPHGGRPRVIARAGALDLTLETPRTLRWTNLDGTLDWYDITPQPCPRPGYATVVAQGGVEIDRRRYGDEADGISILRACDETTHRDRVIAQSQDAFPDSDEIDAVGLSQPWVLLAEQRVDREGCEPQLVWSVNALSGARTPVTALTDCDAPGVAAPRLGDPVAITASGAGAWVANGALVAAVAGKLVTLYSGGGAIADLHAEGDAVVWTHDGAARSAVPAG